MIDQFEFEIVLRGRPSFTFEKPVSDAEMKLLTAYFNEILKEALIQADIEEE